MRWKKSPYREVWLAWDALFRVAAGLRPRHRRAGERRKVLVVRLDYIGDFLLWTPSARRLRGLYPRETHELVLVANRQWSALAAETGWFDRVIRVDRGRLVTNPAYRWRTWSAVWEVGADVSLQPTYSRELLGGDAVVRVSGARDRVGSTGDLSNRTEADRRVGDAWYTRLVPASAERLGELERNAEFLRGLGVPETRAELPFLPVQGALPEGFGGGGWYVLFVGASVGLKRWPVDKVARLAERLHAAADLRGVIAGGPGEEAVGTRLQEVAAVPLENWVGRTSLSELAAVIRGARLVVTNDTAAVHLAAAVGTPVVCIVGGGHFGRFVPYRVSEPAAGPVPAAVFHEMPCYHCYWRCIYELGPDEAAPCVRDVTVEAVWAEVSKILASRKDRP